ncbi:putative protease [Anaerobranca californiensis DSM 14826]|jgi:putative protease|uniref:Putative protease n=1 Tax=Anaerobranca californiensis DSM 14826 TaxID=1120989 RepID=A0A1M6REN1_9FIRM|nr:U32 family peptidase [Anaerobranca californiensis]SHK30860.1 putative protease [Anaerobranca californiensis DSM 14826]
MDKKYEILAPAGSFDNLIAAVQNGADAIYLAGKDFGARKFAQNFDNEELIRAIEYCHIRGVNLYVTVNTLVFNNEFDKLKEYIDFLYTNDVDAIIVQDMGVLQYVRENYPDFKIHCSTQMSVQIVEDIKYLESLGVSRVVLGREMTIEEIKRAKRETKVELEAFIHGALCISISGQCLMSSFIGGRSGNRGSCAQPCRQKYTLYDKDRREKYNSVNGDYLLSPKDLCTIEEVNKIIAAGIFSLKIEGRMKSSEYVAATVRAYRQFLQQEDIDIENLEKDLKVFNRGFTKGHLFGETKVKLMSMLSPSNQGYYLGQVVKYDKKRGKLTIFLEEDLYHNDEIQIRRKDETVGARVERLELGGKVVKHCSKGQICQVNFKYYCERGEKVYKTYDEKRMKELRGTFAKESLEIPVNMEIFIKKDKEIIASITDGSNIVVENTGVIPQIPLNKELTKEEVYKGLSKTGGTPYKLVDLKIDLDSGLFLGMKDINGIRKKLVEKLNDKRKKKYHQRESKLSSQIVLKEKSLQPTEIENKEKREKLQLTFSVNNLAALQALMERGVTDVYYRDLDSLEEGVRMGERIGFKGRIIPEIFKTLSSEQLRKYKLLISKLGLDTVLIQSYGHISLFAEFNQIADFTLNIVNDHSYNFYLDNNFRRITISPELNLKQIERMSLDSSKTEILGYGYIPVMTMKHCVISTVVDKGGKCGFCLDKNLGLMDKTGEFFPIGKRYNCITEIYNSKKLLLVEDYQKLVKAGVGYFRLNFFDESPEEIKKVVSLHQNFITGQLEERDFITIKGLKTSGFTKGHLYRGVE